MSLTVLTPGPSISLCHSLCHAAGAFLMSRWTRRCQASLVSSTVPTRPALVPLGPARALPGRASEALLPTATPACPSTPITTTAPACPPTHAHACLRPHAHATPTRPSRGLARSGRAVPDSEPVAIRPLLSAAFGGPVAEDLLVPIRFSAVFGPFSSRLGILHWSHDQA